MRLSRFNKTNIEIFKKNNKKKLNIKPIKQALSWIKPFKNININNEKKSNQDYDPIWIITCPRSGSTYLSNILNKIILGNNVSNKLFFAEHYNPDNYLSYYHKKIFYDIYDNIDLVKKKSKKDHFLEKYNKIIIDKKLYPKYNKLFFCHIPKWKKSDFIDVKNSLPRLKCIHLIRKDIYNQTISFYFAEKINKWIFIDNNNEKYLKEKIEFNEKHIIQLYNDSLRNKQQCYYKIESLNCPYHTVYYEDLCENLDIELCKICEFLSIDKSKISLIHSKEFENKCPKIITHPLKHKYVEKLRKLIERN